MRFTSIILITTVIAVCFSTSCSTDPPTADQLSADLVAAYELRTSLSYDIDYGIKFFSDTKDTTKATVSVDLIRVAGDTVFGGYVWIKEDSIDRYYNTEHLYFINHTNRSVTRYPADISYPITGNFVGEVIKVYFLKPERLVEGAQDSLITKTITAETLDGRKAWKWYYEFPEDEYTENTWKSIWIDQKDFGVRKMLYSADMQGENQYNRWLLSKVTFDAISPDELEKRFETSTEGYVVEDYEPPGTEDYDLLADGTVIPELSGKLYGTEEATKLAELQGKLTLVDFWYMDCFPCIKAIPHLNELYDRYQEQGLAVIGVNPFDDNEEDLARMPNFIEKNTLGYPILLTEREAVTPFLVQVYPSFYLLDNQGKVIHSELGFSEEMVPVLDSLIRANL
jgi:thiol-disulfide isomerase/thioredoxin